MTVVIVPPLSTRRRKQPRTARVSIRATTPKETAWLETFAKHLHQGVAVAQAAAIADAEAGQQVIESSKWGNETR
jgi:hypothetical protein